MVVVPFLLAVTTAQAGADETSLRLSDRMMVLGTLVEEPHEQDLNRVGLFLGATTKTSNGHTEFSIGVEYERHLTELLGFGGVFEWEPSFEERVLVAPALFIHPVGDLLVTVAPGAQFEEHSTQFVFRVGVAWEFELGDGFGLAPTISYDFVESGSDAVSYGLVLNFSF